MARWRDRRVERCTGGEGDPEGPGDPPVVLGRGFLGAGATGGDPPEAPLGTSALSRYCIDANYISVVELDLVFCICIKREYDNDVLFKNVMQRLRQGEQLRQRYVIEKDLLYYTQQGVRRLCIPHVQPIINAILGECHDSVLGGHLGVDKTFHLV